MSLSSSSSQKSNCSSSIHSMTTSNDIDDKKFDCDYLISKPSVIQELDIYVLKVIRSDCYVVREDYHSKSSSDNAKRFAQMELELNQYYKRAQTDRYWDKKEGQLVVVKTMIPEKTEKMWVRGEIVAVLQSVLHDHYEVFLVDYGVNIQVQHYDLHKYDISKFGPDILPFQAFRFELTGLKPINLVINPLNLRPEFKKTDSNWQSSSEEFIKNLFYENNCRVKASIENKKEHYIAGNIIFSDGTNLRSRLVQRKYAEYDRKYFKEIQKRFIKSEKINKNKPKGIISRVKEVKDHFMTKKSVDDIRTEFDLVFGIQENLKTENCFNNENEASSSNTSINNDLKNYNEELENNEEDDLIEWQFRDKESARNKDDDDDDDDENEPASYPLIDILDSDDELDLVAQINKEDDDDDIQILTNYEVTSNMVAAASKGNEDVIDDSDEVNVEDDEIDYEKELKSSFFDTSKNRGDQEDIVERVFSRIQNDTGKPTDKFHSINELVAKEKIIPESFHQILDVSPEQIFFEEDYQSISSDDEEDEPIQMKNILYEPMDPDIEFEYGYQIDPNAISRKACLKYAASSLKFPEPFIKMENVYMNKNLLDHIIKRLNFKSCKLQLHLWPAIIKKLNFICISNSNTGKTTAYLVPILSQFYNLQQSNSAQFKLSNSVSTIVICSSSRKVNLVARQAQKLKSNTSGYPRINTLYLSNEKNQRNSILNGCEFLITTPGSLHRFLEENVIDTVNLKYLVFDDGDTILETNRKQFHEIFLKIAKIKKANKDLTTKAYQILIFTEKWTKWIKWVYNEYLDHPHLLFSCFYEAAIANQIGCEFKLVEAEINREKDVKLLINNLMEENVRFAIVCNNSNESKVLPNYLKLTTNSYIIIDETTEIFKNEAQLKRWTNKSNCILITTDKAIPFLSSQYNMIKYIVHYKLPKEDFVRTFGTRFKLMSEYFKQSDMSKENFDNKSQLKTFIFASPNDIKYVCAIFSFMRRLSCPIPRELNNLMRKSQMPLCPRYAKFASCYLSSNGCLGRHYFNSFDVPNLDLPQNGQIKIIVSHVISANEFYIRINGFRNENNFSSWNANFLTFDIIQPKLIELKEKVLAGQVKYITLNELKQNEIYGIDIRDKVQRCKIVEILKDDDSFSFYEEEKTSKTIRIFCIDYGHEIITQSRNLFHLPNQLKQYHDFAYKAYLFGIIPSDNESEWDYKASCNLFQIIDYGIVDNITAWILRQSNSVFWLTDLQVTKKLTSNLTYFIPGKDLIREKLAVHNPHTLPGINNDLDLIRAKYSNYKIEQKIQKPFLLDCEYTFLSYFVNMNEIYLQRETTFNYLTEREKGDWKMDLKPVKEFFEGRICLCKFGNEDFEGEQFSVNRSRITQVHENTVDVFFLDHGDSEKNVPKSHCFLITQPKIVEDFPLQAVRVKLYGIEEIKEIPLDFIYDNTRDKNEHFKMMLTEVVSKKPDHYVVRTFVEQDNDSQLLKSIAKILVDKGYAEFTDENEKERDIYTMKKQIVKDYRDDEDSLAEFLADNFFSEISGQVEGNVKEMIDEAKEEEVKKPLSRKMKIKKLNELMKKEEKQKKNNQAIKIDDLQKEIKEIEQQEIDEAKVTKDKEKISLTNGVTDGSYLLPYDPDDIYDKDNLESDDDALLDAHDQEFDMMF